MGLEDVDRYGEIYCALSSVMQCTVLYCTVLSYILLVCLMPSCDVIVIIVSQMLLFGILVAFCIGGYNYAMQYISPLVFSSVQLIDPAVTGLISWLAGM